MLARTMTKPLLFIACLWAPLVATAQPATLEAARQQFEAQHWEEAAHLLQSLPANAETRRMLALSLAGSGNFQQAAPAVAAALQDNPNDTRLLRAEVDIHLQTGDLAAARESNRRLAAAGATDWAAYYDGAIAEAAGDPVAARQAWQGLLNAPDADMAQRSAARMVMSLQAAGDHERAAEVASAAVARKPDSFLAYRLSRVTPVAAGRTAPLRISAGYRLEYDDNVALLPDNSGILVGAPNEEDYRHVLYGDLLYRKDLANRFSLYGEAHLSQSFHHDYDQFNLTRANGVIGTGQAFDRWGWRLPLEVLHERFDGDSFRTITSATPGVYFKVSPLLFTHFYMRLDDADYDDVSSPSEDRSGDTTALGVLLTGQLAQSWSIRAFIEWDDFDTDGANWQREEWRYYGLADYSGIQDWNLGGGFRYVDADFDNVNDFYFTTRNDEVTELFLLARYQWGNDWVLSGQYTWVDQSSTIDIYSYDRSVISLGISREF